MKTLHLRSFLPLLVAGFTTLTALAAVPGGPPIYTEDFETGAPGFTFSGLWHVTTNYPDGGASALAFCENETANGTTPDGDYDIGDISQSCFSGPIVIPSGAWQLEFDAFNGDEYNVSPGGFDSVSVGVSLDGSTVDSFVASSAPSSGGQYIPEWGGPGSEQYYHIVADLSAYAGKTIQLVFNYATYDDLFNSYPGARLDNLTIVPGVPPPVAVDDKATSNGDPVIISVLDNDQSPSGQSLSIANFTSGYYGDVSDNGDGTLTYTPNSSYDGRDFFQYNISDGSKQSAYATVSIRNSVPLYKDIAVIHQPVLNQSSGTNYSAVGALPDESLGHFLGKYKSKTNYSAIFNGDGSLALDSTLVPSSADGAHVGTFYAPSGDGTRAKLKVGAGTPAVTSASDSVVLADLFTFPLVVAREGGLAPGTPLHFKSFTSVSSAFTYGGVGVAVMAAKSGGHKRDGFTRASHGAAIAPSSVGGVKTDGFGGYSSTTYFTAKLDGSNSKTNVGLWAYDDYSGTVLLTRQGDTFDYNGKTVQTITALKGGSGSGAENRATTPEGGCLVRIAFTDKTQVIGEFILSYSSVAFYPIAQSADSSPIADASYVGFGIPAASHGTTAFAAKIAGPGVSGANNSVVVVNGAVVAQKGQAVPGLSGATFAAFKDPVAGGYFSGVMTALPGSPTGGNAAFIAKIRGTGLSSANNTVLCHWDGTQLAVFARTGDNAPGGGATFNSFVSLALGSDLSSGPVFTAKLNGSKPTGLWSAAPDNTVSLLALDGGTLPSFGQTRQVKGLGALKAASGSSGNGRGYDDLGHAYIYATFVDGTKSLIRVTTP